MARTTFRVLYRRAPMHPLVRLWQSFLDLFTTDWWPLLANQRGSITVDTAFIHAVSANVTVLAQQKRAMVSDASCIRREEGVVGVTKDFERIAAFELENLQSRHQDTPILNPEHTRRRAFFTDAGGGVYVDKVDEVKMLIDAQSTYAGGLARAQNVKFDRLVIAAFNASISI